LAFKASEDIFGAPQFDCPPQTPGLDPPLLRLWGFPFAKSFEKSFFARPPLLILWKTAVVTSIFLQTILALSILQWF